MMGKQEGVFQADSNPGGLAEFWKKNISTFTFLEFPGKHTLVVEQQELAGGLFLSWVLLVHRGAAKQINLGKAASSGNREN